MADLNQLDSSMTTKIAGADSSGNETTFLKVDANGNIAANMVDTSGVPFGTEANPLFINGNAEILSPLPSLKLSKVIALPANGYTEAQTTITTRTALKEFHIGGRAACEGFIANYQPTVEEYIPSGGFNSSGQVSAWTNTGGGSSGLLTWAYATDQFTEGTGSAKLTFTQSDQNNYPEITYTYSTPKDMSVWKRIQAKVRTTVAAGGAQSRTVQVRLTSGTAIRIYSVNGTTNTAPFSTEQWHTIDLDLESPSSIAGTGVFDINNVNSVSLRLQDGGNKAGSIWWDDVKLIGSFNILEKIYTPGVTTQLQFDPVIIFEVGQILYLFLKNNSATATEFQISTTGVNIT